MRTKVCNKKINSQVNTCFDRANIQHRWDDMDTIKPQRFYTHTPAAGTDYHKMRWAHSTFGPVFLYESILSSFIPPRHSGPRNFKVRCLIPALSFATVYFHVRTHSTRAIFLAVIKLLETHQYSRPHSCISFLLNETGQTSISPLAKRLKLATIDEGDSKTLFSTATTPVCREGCYSFSWIAPLYSWSILYNTVLSKEESSTIFRVFGMTRPEIESRSPGPLANVTFCGKFSIQYYLTFKWN